MNSKKLKSLCSKENPGTQFYGKHTPKSIYNEIITRLVTTRYKILFRQETDNSVRRAKNAKLFMNYLSFILIFWRHGAMKRFIRTLHALAFQIPSCSASPIRQEEISDLILPYPISFLRNKQALLTNTFCSMVCKTKSLTSITHIHTHQAYAKQKKGLVKPVGQLTDNYLLFF